MFIYHPHEGTFTWSSRTFEKPVSFQEIIDTQEFKTYETLTRAFKDIVNVPTQNTLGEFAAPVGTQVLYMPHHAERDPNHEDVEAGFIWRWFDMGRYKIPSCRYFHMPSLRSLSLRTVANGEQTALTMLFPVLYTGKRRIQELLDKINQHSQTD